MATITRTATAITSHRTTVLIEPIPSDRVADYRTRHAVPAAAALAELEPLDRDDLDAGLTHLGDRVGVALVGDDHTRLERDDVVAVVPLLALLLVGVTTGLHHLQLGDPHGVGHGGEEVLLLRDMERALGGAGPQADRPDVGHDP